MSKFKTTLELVVKETKHGWSYEIYESDKILIKQEVIPVVTGMQYFKSKEDAKKIGKLVIRKLKNNERPTINLKDLEDSDIYYK